MTQKMTDFSLDNYGFKFNNNFTTDMIWGPVHITTSGRCGGMSYTSLDGYFYKEPVPDDKSLPPEGSVLNTYIYERQIQSLVGTVTQWEDFLFNPLGNRSWDLHNRGRKNHIEFQRLINEIDANGPCNLCLVAPTPDPGKSHQVIATGYKVGTGTGKDELEVYICDPNFHGEIVILYPDVSQPLYHYRHQSDNSLCKKDGKVITWLAYFTDRSYVKRRPPNWIDTDTKIYENRDFSGQHLDHKDFRNDNLIGANFRGATVSRTDFQGADLTGSIFTGAYGVTNNFTNAILDFTNFVGADLRLSEFQGVCARSAVFDGANLGALKSGSKAVFSGSYFIGTDLNRSHLDNAVFHRCSFTGADLSGAVLRESDFTQAYMVGCNLGSIRSARLVIFDRANLDGADLKNSSFPASSFAYANLSHACLNTTQVKDCDFTCASLTKADLRGADFRGAKLYFANMLYADMRGAKFGSNDWTGAMIIGANIQGATGIPASIRRQVGQ